MSTRNVYLPCIDCGTVRFMKRAFSNIRRCVSCTAKLTNKRSNSASKAGLVGGRKTADSGKLREFATKASHSKTAEIKRFDTLRRRGLLYTSKPEKHLYMLLINKFGVDDVKHQVIVNGYRIDFYIKSINTYVQLDGEYWHGLNKPYDQLSGAPKEKFNRDRKCDQYFTEQNLRLIRITDKELKLNESVINRV